MSVLSFPPRDHRAGCGVDIRVDDDDESLNRFGSDAEFNRYAHLAVNTTVLAAITGFPTEACEEFHHTLFSLLEAVGDFDGLIATPLVCIGQVDARARAQEWLAAHPAVDVGAMRAGDDDPTGDDLDTDEQLWARIMTAIEAHSLDLAAAVGTNPSLTFGSLEAVSERLQTDICDIAPSCITAQVTTMTEVALDLTARLPESVHIVGGAGRTTRLTRDTFRGWQA
jgi:hypothetical protein